MEPPRRVTMRPPDFALDLDALAAAGRGARMLVLNSPHNPTGRVLDRAELAGAGLWCRGSDAGEGAHARPCD